MLDAALPPAQVTERVRLYGSYARPVTLPSGVALPCRDIGEIAFADLRKSIVLHYAYLTKDKLRELSADAFAAANDRIQNALCRAWEDAPPLAVFFPSSGAVYKRDGSLVDAPDQSPYGWAKLRDEARFIRLASATGTRLSNGRIFSLAGEYINKPQLYALASLLVDIHEGRPIKINAAHPVWRSYAYVGDVINLSLALGLENDTSLTFDIAGDEPVEIGELARLCADVCGRPDHEIIRPAMSGAPEDRMLGTPDVFYRLMKEHRIAPLTLRQQVVATARFLGIL